MKNKFSYKITKTTLIKGINEEYDEGFSFCFFAKENKELKFFSNDYSSKIIYLNDWYCQLLIDVKKNILYSVIVNNYKKKVIYTDIVLDNYVNGIIYYDDLILNNDDCIHNFDDKLYYDETKKIYGIGNIKSKGVLIQFAENCFATINSNKLECLYLIIE